MEINPHELIWAIINFFVLLAILLKFLYKPLINTLDKRKQEIEDNLTGAELANKEAKETLARYEKRLEEAKKEAENIISKAVKESEQKRQEIAQEAREEANKTLEKAKKEIQMEKEQALTELREEVATLAVLAAGKVIQKEIKPEDHERMVKSFVSEVGHLQ